MCAQKAPTDCSILTVAVLGAEAACVRLCSGLENGFYQSCFSCKLYVWCFNGIFLEHRMCTGYREWDDTTKTCTHISPACPWFDTATMIKNNYFTLTTTLLVHVLQWLFCHLHIWWIYKIVWLFNSKLKLHSSHNLSFFYDKYAILIVIMYFTLIGSNSYFELLTMYIFTYLN